jgi:hypothetical protein
MLDRIDVGTAILVGVVTLGLLALVLWGPVDHRGTAGLALVGLLGTVAAALRGRLVKRDPDSFKEGDK